MPLYPPISLLPILPELVLAVAACIVLVVSQSRRAAIKGLAPWVSLTSIVIALMAVWYGARVAASSWEPVAGSGLVFDSLAAFVRLSSLIVGFVITLVLWSQPQDSERGEFFSMVLLTLSGLLVLGPMNDLLNLFLALELVSIPTYIMVVLSRTRRESAEAATKYFYLGALSAAIMAYGFSFLYGVAGTTQLLSTDGSASIAAAVTAALTQPGTMEHTLTVVGLLLSMTGLLFKIAAVPMHFYIADVYQGAASSVAGLLGFVPKFGGIVALFKLLALVGWQTLQPGLYEVLWIVAALSMTIGNVLALRQTNIKRMLAYSGIAHAGYMLVGVIAGPHLSSAQDGAAAVLFYAVVYGLANLAGFAVLGLLRVRGRSAETLRDIAGLVRVHPGLALLMALAMLSLMGMPPIAGFWGKLTLFGTAIGDAVANDSPYRTWTIALVVIALLNSALAAAYYLRVTAAVLLYDNDEPAAALPRDAEQTGALVCGLLLLAFTFRPSLLMQPGRQATASMTATAVAAAPAEPEQQPPPAPVAADNEEPENSAG